MQEPRSHGVDEDEQPVVRPVRVRPFELPRLRVAEKVDLAQTFGVRVLNGEIRQELERRTRANSGS
jgi:hypothetical protein